MIYILLFLLVFGIWFMVSRGSAIAIKDMEEGSTEHTRQVMFVGYVTLGAVALKTFIIIMACISYF